MKHLGTYNLLYFFTFLLTVSCSDASVYTGNTQTTVQKDSHSQDDHHSDLCSPFCTCSCCGMHITATNFAVSASVPFHRYITTKSLVRLLCQHSISPTESGNLPKFNFNHLMAILWPSGIATETLAIVLHGHSVESLQYHQSTFILRFETDTVDVKSLKIKL